jgi:hypothetical protein
MLADLAHLAHHAHGALVLGVVLGAVERALLERRARVDGRVAGGAHLELGKLVKLDLDRVVGVAFALGFGLAGLLHTHQVSLWLAGRMGGKERIDRHTVSRILLAPPFANILFAKLSAEL